MDIMQLLGSDMGKQIISGLGSQAGTNENETASVVNAALPVLMGMLQKNASTPEGASGLLGALNQHDGGILNNLQGFLKGGDTSDGNGILGHILGGNKSKVEGQISEQTGVSAASVGKIVAMLAPIVMGVLGQKSKQSNVSSGGGIGDLLGGLMGGGSSSSIGGNILGSLLGGGGGNSGGGIGGLLGGLFGKK